MTKHRYTKEQIDYLRKIAAGRTREKITAMFNKKFNAQCTVKAISNQLSRHGIRTGMRGHTTRWKKGQKAWNKDMKGLQLGGEKGWFQKGHVHVNKLPVSAESMWNDRLMVKIAEPNVWQLKHHYLYEKHVGPIPEGHIVIFADQDKTNFDLANLVLVQRDVHTAAVHRKLLFEDSEATKTGVIIAELLMKANKLEQQKQ